MCPCLSSWAENRVWLVPAVSYNPTIPSTPIPCRLGQPPQGRNGLGAQMLCWVRRWLPDQALSVRRRPGLRGSAVADSLPAVGSSCHLPDPLAARCRPLCVDISFYARSTTEATAFQGITSAITLSRQGLTTRSGTGSMCPTRRSGNTPVNHW